MRNRALVALVVVGLLGLALVTFGSAVVPESVHSKSSSAKPLAGSRFFMLLPDGKVEITDAWARRVYRWDGRQWVEQEVTRVPTAPAETR
jgi:hypothetical protein